jgi:hypothetical protein
MRGAGRCDGVRRRGAVRYTPGHGDPGSRPERQATVVDEGAQRLVGAQSLVTPATRDPERA